LECSENESDQDTTAHRSTLPGIAFYFFEERRKGDNSASDALRAILAQLVHIHRHNKAVIDVLSVVWNKDDTGQATATSNEVSSILELLFDQVISTTLVFDAIDECSEDEALLKSIYTITKNARHVPILIFSRPTVKVPREWNSNPRGYSSLELRESQNLYDMVNFIRPKMVELLDTGALAQSATRNADEIALKIALRANGMFLWVSLLFDYLQSPALSVRERLDALENVNRLEGLDALCSTILAALKRRYHGKSRTNIRRAFQWVAHAVRPLRIVELNTALNIPVDRSITSEDLIPNLKDSLPLISGALLEVSSDMTVNFIHLSIKEFFIRPSSGALEHLDAHGFDFQANQSHRYMASSCLSYFCYSVPPVPLSGTASVTPDVTVQDSRFLFLKYASSFWSHHLDCSLRGDAEHDQITDESCSWDHLTSMISKFLYNKSMVTVWIEASWLFGTPPKLIFSASQAEIRKFSLSIPPQRLPQFQSVLENMRTLSSDLHILNASWRHVLQTEPNEIWQPSISAFQQSDFWTRIPGSNIIPLGQSPEDEYQLGVLCSQVSLDGSRIGIVKGEPGGWITSEGVYHFRYEIRNINPDESLFVYTINISEWSWNRPGPIVISRDLRKICLRDLLLKFDITHSYDETGSHVECPFGFGSVYGSLSRSGFSCHYVHPIWLHPGDQGNHALLQSKVSDNVKRDLIKNVSDFRRKSIHIQLSPNGEYVLAVVESTRLLRADHDPTTSARFWVAEVFRDTCHHSNDIRLESQSLTYYLPPSGTKVEWLDREVAFHPFLPQLALSRFHDTCLWNFNRCGGRSIRSSYCLYIC